MDIHSLHANGYWVEWSDDVILGGAKGMLTYKNDSISGCIRMCR